MIKDPSKETNERWAEYDKKRMNSQKNTINSLQNEIKEYQKREKAFQAHLKFKDNQIYSSEKEIEDLLKRHSETVFDLSNNEIFLDPLLHKEYLTLKDLIGEKDEILLDKEHYFELLQTNQINQAFKKAIPKCREIVKENMELNNYLQSGILENLKFENGLEKSQIDQLMIKLKEKEIVNQEFEYELNELNEEINQLNEKMREIEDKKENAAMN